MGGGSPGVSLPDLGGIWFAVSASFPGRVVNHDGRVCIVWVRCLPSGVVSVPGWCFLSSGRSPALCVALCGSWGL